MPTVLFLCSGNYYRSRFAELLFNHLAVDEGLDWRAESRGFRLSPANVGPLSRHAVAGLQARGIAVPEPRRSPRVVEAHDFDAFDRVIAVKEEEHRPLMLERFPQWAQRIDYWHIHDLDCSEPEIALVELENQVRGLVARLAH
jgi:protein-tyrosine phosphatase